MKKIKAYSVILVASPFIIGGVVMVLGALTVLDVINWGWNVIDEGL